MRNIHSLFSGGLLTLLALFACVFAKAEKEIEYDLTVLAVKDGSIINKATQHCTGGYELETFIAEKDLLKGLPSNYFADDFTCFDNNGWISYDYETDNHTVYPNDNATSLVVIANIIEGTKVNFDLQTKFYGDPESGDSYKYTKTYKKGSKVYLSTIENTYALWYLPSNSYTMTSYAIGSEVTKRADFLSGYEEGTYLILPDEDEADITVNFLRYAETVSFNMKKSAWVGGSKVAEKTISVPTGTAITTELLGFDADLSGKHIAKIVMSGKDVTAKVLVGYDYLIPTMPFDDIDVAVYFENDASHKLTFKVNYKDYDQEGTPTDKSIEASADNVPAGSLIRTLGFTYDHRSENEVFGDIYSMIKEYDFATSINGGTPTYDDFFVMPNEDATAVITMGPIEESDDPAVSETFDLEIISYLNGEEVASGKGKFPSGKQLQYWIEGSYDAAWGTYVEYICRYVKYQSLEPTENEDYFFVEATTLNNECIPLETHYPLESMTLNGQPINLNDLWNLPAQGNTLELFYVSGTNLINVLTDATTENGTISANKTSTYDGCEVIVTANPADGYVAATLSVDGDPNASVDRISANTFSVTFSNEAKPYVTLSATFEKEEYHNLTIMAVLDGVIINKKVVNLEATTTLPLDALIDMTDLLDDVDATFYYDYNSFALYNAEEEHFDWVYNGKYRTFTMGKEDVTLVVNLAKGVWMSVYIAQDGEVVDYYDTLVKCGGKYALWNVTNYFANEILGGDKDFNYIASRYAFNDEPSKLIGNLPSSMQTDGEYIPIPTDGEDFDVTIYYVKPDAKFNLTAKLAINGVVKETIVTEFSGESEIKASPSALAFQTNVTGYHVASAILDGTEDFTEILQSEHIGLMMPYSDAELVINYEPNSVHKINLSVSANVYNETSEKYELVTKEATIEGVNAGDIFSPLAYAYDHRSDEVMQDIIGMLKEMEFTISIDGAEAKYADSFVMPARDVNVAVVVPTSYSSEYGLTVTTYLDGVKINEQTTTWSSGKIENIWAEGDPDYGYFTNGYVLSNYYNGMSEIIYTETVTTENSSVDYAVLNGEKLDLSAHWDMPAEASKLDVYLVSSKTVVNVFVDGTIANGSISIDKSTTYTKSKVTVSGTPDEGFFLSNVTISGDKATVTKNDDGTFSFVISADAETFITVSATFSATDPTALSAAAADDFNVTVAGKSINVSGTDKFSVYDLSGREIAADATGSVRVAAAGLYVVTSGDKSAKVLVK